MQLVGPDEEFKINFVLYHTGLVRTFCGWMRPSSAPICMLLFQWRCLLSLGRIENWGNAGCWLFLFLLVLFLFFTAHRKKEWSFFYPLTNNDFAASFHFSKAMQPISLIFILTESFLLLFSGSFDCLAYLPWCVHWHWMALFLPGAFLTPRTWSFPSIWSSQDPFCVATGMLTR